MSVLLLAFAIPILIIILSIVLQKILKCPFLVASTFFAILLVIEVALFDLEYLIFVIIYTILSYIVAILTKLICNILNRICFNNIINEEETIENNCIEIGQINEIVNTNCNRRKNCICRR